MAQTNALITTLKQQLKMHGITYRDIAEQLNLAPTSIKRLFSQENISLQRLDQICQLMAIEISDLVSTMNAQQTKVQQLSIEQEKEITQDITLLLITVCVLNNWTMADIVEYYQLKETDCIQKLAKLDRLNVIELQVNNRIKLKVAANFNWRENGPIQQFFQQAIGQEYFNSQFKHDDEILLVLNGMLSSESNAEFQRKLKRLANEFNLLSKEDGHLPLVDRNGVTTVLAMRGWRYGLFEHIKTLNK